LNLCVFDSYGLKEPYTIGLKSSDIRVYGILMGNKLRYWVLALCHTRIFDFSMFVLNDSTFPLFFDEDNTHFFRPL
jgi:hypothetical protein